MKKAAQQLTLALALAGVLAAGQAMATVVDFTAGEGYANGDLTNNAAWNGEGGNTVSTAGSGLVTLAPYTDWIECIYTNGMDLNAEGDTITLSAKFQYDTTSLPPSGSALISLQFFDDDTVSTNFVRVGLRRLFDEKLQFYLGVQGGQGDAQVSGSIAETYVGLPYQGAGTSDWLGMTAALRKGSSSNNWQVTVVLTNLTSPGLLLQRTFTGVGPSPGFQDDATVYGAINSSPNDSTSATENRVVDTFSMTSGYTPGVPPVTTYDFSSTPFPYVNGPLAGQDSWLYGINNLVTNGIVKFPAVDWERSWQQRGVDALANDEFTVSAVFSFSETGPWTANKQFMNVALEDVPYNLGGAIRASIERYANNAYAIRLWSDLGGEVTGSWVSCPANLMGLDLDADVDLNSDLLELALTLKRGASASEWTYVLQVNNLATKLNAATSVGTAALGANMFTATNWYAGLNSGQAGGDITNRAVYSLTFGARSGDTVVEWGGLGGQQNAFVDNNIVTAITNFRNNLVFGSYSPNNTNNPTVGASYYPSATGRTPIFNGAATVSASVQGSVRTNGTAGDYIQVGNSTNHFENMVCWEVAHWLTNQTHLNGLEMECIVNGNVDGATEGRWVIRKAGGSWYASESFTLADNGWQNSFVQSFYPAGLTWYNFTPITDGIGTVGAQAAIDMQNIDIVGCYGVWNNSVEIWRGINVRYFKALGIASTVAPPPSCTAPTLSIVRNGANVDISWASANGCTYQLQTKSTLTGAWSDLYAAVAGDGTIKTLPVPATSTPGQGYFRVIIP